MKKYLVTGAAGFIGSHVARILSDSDALVIGVDDFSGGSWENVPVGVPCLTADLTQSDMVAAIFANNGPFDAVFHLAAYAAEGLSHNIAGFNYTNNLLATVNLVNESVKQAQRGDSMPHFVFTSSIAVYGHAEKLPVDEESPTNPADPYGVAKLACEGHIKAANGFFGLPYTIFRPYNVYGPGQNLNDPYRNVVGIFLRKMLSGEPMTIYGDGAQSRAFSYIDDVAPVIARSIDTIAALNETFCIGGEVHCTVDQLAGHVAKALGMEKKVEWLDARNEVKVVYASPKKVRKAFGIKETSVPLAEGVKKMATWAEAQALQLPKPFAGIEVTLNLPKVYADLNAIEPPKPIYGVVRRPSNAELMNRAAAPTINPRHGNGHLPDAPKIGGNTVQVQEFIAAQGHQELREG
jgi:UDP-glucose 4-epimerase